jgi:surface polysaccharide O-acyltransferase-like enzyme
MHAGFDCDPETWIAHEYTYGFPFTHLRGTLRGNGTSMFGMEKSKKRYHPAILMANFALALAALMVLAMVCEFVIPARWVTANFYLALALVGILCACVLWIWWESHVTPLWRPSSGDFLLVIQLTSIGLLFVVCLCTVIRHVFNRAGDSGGRERLVR